MKTTASVRYKTEILKKGKVVRSQKTKNNLLLDVGMDEIAVRSWANCFTHCHVGTGITPVKRASSPITFSRSGTTVTASASFFESADEGRLLKLNSGEEMYVTSYTSNTEVEVSEDGVISSSEGTVWYVNETGHGNGVKWSSLCSSDEGANGSVYDPLTSELAMKRTIIFSAETAEQTYTEIGWTWHTNLSGDLLGRDLIPDGGITLQEDEQLRVVVELILVLSPTTPTAVTATNEGNAASFDPSGTEGIEIINSDMDLVGMTSTTQARSGIDYVRPTGVTHTATRAPLNAHGGEPHAQLTEEDFTQEDAQVDPTAGSFTYIPDLVMNENYEAYVPGSFRRAVVFTHGLTTGNLENARGVILFSALSNSQRRRNFSIKFTTPQTKDSDHTLEIVFELQWGRTLVN